MLKQNKWLIFAISGPVLAALVVIGYLLYVHMYSGGPRTLKIGDQTVYVSVADTEATRELGLGGRESLASDEGMLFIFPTEGTYSFWMKDMHFAIDMLWISNNGTIIHIQSDVVPATYPESFAPTSAEGLARYVLELPAGYAREHNIKVGDKVAI
jgi:uncharacterized membrane protein (UPF0127 family)